MTNYRHQEFLDEANIARGLVMADRGFAEGDHFPITMTYQIPIHAVALSPLGHAHTGKIIGD